MYAVSLPAITNGGRITQLAKTRIVRVVKAVRVEAAWRFFPTIHSNGVPATINRCCASHTTLLIQNIAAHFDNRWKPTRRVLLQLSTAKVKQLVNCQMIKSMALL